MQSQCTERYLLRHFSILVLMLILYLSGARTSTSGPKARINWSTSRVGITLMVTMHLYSSIISCEVCSGFETMYLNRSELNCKIIVSAYCTS